MKRTVRTALTLAFSLIVCMALAYEPCQRRLPIGVTGPQIVGALAKIEATKLSYEKKVIPSWRIVFSKPDGVPSQVLWSAVNPSGWKEDEGLIFFFRPDGSNSYIDLVIFDPATNALFSYGITTRDPACREVFVPFKQLSSQGKPFKPQEHARISIGWRPNSGYIPKSDVVFATGGYCVVQLNPAEMAWPASTPFFVGTPVYMETYEGTPKYTASKGAAGNLVSGPPATGIASSLEVTLPSMDSEISWDFADTGRWQYFDGMSVWFKGIVPGSRFFMDLIATRLDGKGDVLFRHDFLVSGQGWDVEHIEWDDFLDDKGHNIEPEDYGHIVLFVLSASGQQLPLHIWVGPFRLDDE